jgi:hypothetical protein
MDALLSLDNPVTHKYNILFKKALLCRQDILSTLHLLSPFIRRKAYQIKDTKGAIRSNESNDRQYNDQRKNDIQ